MIDIDASVHTADIATFADDTKIWRVINGEDASASLQHDLNHLYHWASANNMQFNDTKFEHLIFAPSPDTVAPGTYTTPANLLIPTATTVRDLGVLFSSDGKFTPHILQTVKGAQQLSQWVLRTFKT